MIVVNLMGGLGNQMFQYAIGRKLAIQHQTSLFLDCTFLNSTNFGHLQRTYELDIFKIDATIAGKNELRKIALLQNNATIRFIHSIFPSLFSFHLVHEKTHAFNTAVIHSPDNSWINGFWQTEKYFSDIEKTIRTDFEFTPPLQGLNKELAEQIKTCNSISMHIRRGDYTSTNALAYHGLCNPDYYYNALELISKQIPIEKIFIFSDDIPWVKANMQFNFPVAFVDHNTGKNSFEDMRLMHLCKHNIIANSSFSWWAAWLNTNKNKLVVAPKKWITDPTVDTTDVLPDNWINL